MAAKHGLSLSSSSALLIRPHEIEQLCGLEVNDLWVGSLWAGAYRTGMWRRSPLALLGTELLVLALAAMVSLPLGLLLVRNHAGADLNTPRAALPFALTVAGGTAGLWLLRHRYMAKNQQRWRSLLAILDEVDRYHASLKAYDLLAQLQTIHGSSSTSRFEGRLNSQWEASGDSGSAEESFSLFMPAPHRESELDPAIDEALLLTRDSLTTGLMADQLLRKQQDSAKTLGRNRDGERARYSSLVEHLDQNLITLTAFDASQQVAEDAQLLQEALQISAAVRRNMAE